MLISGLLDLSLDPVIGAIAAGNAVVLKPSEVSPASSALLAKLLIEYMDTSCVRVVEGAVAETTALLQQKWDKICYTGSIELSTHFLLILYDLEIFARYVNLNFRQIIS